MSLEGKLPAGFVAAGLVVAGLIAELVPTPSGI